jgi:hypothetical protein
VIDARRDVVPVRAAAEEERRLTRGKVLPSQRRQLALDGEFGRMRRKRGNWLAQQEIGRNILEQIVDGRGADGASS